MQIARLKISSNSILTINEVSNKIKDLAEKLGGNIKGPIPIPTKKLKIVTRKAVSGDGTSTFDRWEMRIHKRIIDISMNERILKNIVRLEIPDSVNIEIKLVDK
ncbi:MAG: 30S ribosomal protein S10 [Candidatus Aenigmarchaeota archaeon ex4484_52]|nr:MAG: 30S ribosomal protein S10 [Candidatus Aenigmarchaeota archaeon ex4484_52]